MTAMPKLSKRFSLRIPLKPAEIAAVGFRGQTIVHRPERGLTVQIGDGHALATWFGIPVVYDFAPPTSPRGRARRRCGSSPAGVYADAHAGRARCAGARRIRARCGLIGRLAGSAGVCISGGALVARPADQLSRHDGFAATADRRRGGESVCGRRISAWWYRRLPVLSIATDPRWPAWVCHRCA